MNYSNMDEARIVEGVKKIGPSNKGNDVIKTQSHLWGLGFL